MAVLDGPQEGCPLLHGGLRVVPNNRHGVIGILGGNRIFKYRATRQDMVKAVLFTLFYFLGHSLKGGLNIVTGSKKL